MLDQLSQMRMPLAGWVWTETRHIKFDTIFCPFTGRPFIPIMFKEQGKSVITTDMLKTHYHASHALIENGASVLDPFDVDKLLEPNPDKIQLMEGVCNAYGMAPEHGAWLDNVHKNIAKLDDAYKRSLAYVVCTRVIRYLSSFDDSTRFMLPDEDLAGVFNYYVEYMNGRVFSNGRTCEAHNTDANKLAASIDSEAMYFYVPSSIGFSRMDKERRLSEMFNRYCHESELDKYLSIEPNELGAAQDDIPNYLNTVESFLETAAHIPLWIISYNRAGVFKEDRIMSLIGKFKPDVKVFSKKVVHSSSEVLVENLYIGKS